MGVSMGIGSGECICSRVPEGVRVDRADQFIRIANELLAATWIKVIDDLVTFGDINPVTYRLGQRHERETEAERVA
jgi:hypothetical protein